MIVPVSADADWWLGLVAVLTPVVQTALMGFIGYPWSRRRPDGLKRFRRSGFAWWLVALGVVILLTLLLAPQLLSVGSPSQHDPLTLARVVATVALGVAVVLAVEAGGSAVVARSSSRRVSAGRERYESALPPWAASSSAESALVGMTGLLEEAVYRGVLIASLLTVWGWPVAMVAGVSAVGFAAAHWYYGWAQMTIKLMTGSALASVALSAGWMTAAVVHVLVNLGLTAQAHRARSAAAVG